MTVRLFVWLLALPLWWGAVWLSGHLSDNQISHIGTALGFLLLGLLVGSGDAKKLYEAGKPEPGLALFVVAVHVALLIYAWRLLVAVMVGYALWWVSFALIGAAAALLTSAWKRFGDAGD